MVVIGIDPGKTGGLAFMGEGKNVKLFKMPIYPDSNRINVGELHQIVLGERIYYGDSAVYIEVQHVRARQRGGAIIGENYGRILTVLELLDMPYKEVFPRLWKGVVFEGKKIDQDKQKQAAIDKCLELEYELPTLRPKGKVLHDGVADAICIALYGWMDYKGS